MANYYILGGKDEHEAIPSDLMSWAKWYEAGTRIVARTDLPGWACGVRISTVFLGCDHSFGDGPPLLFETMIFGGPHNDYQERYTTWEQAIAGHERAVTVARSMAWREKYNI